MLIHAAVARLRALLALLALLLTSVSHAGGSMQIVAHQDDDLFFMNPAISKAIDAGESVWTVYVTAGDASNLVAIRPPPSHKLCTPLIGASYAQCRERGVEAAYLQMADPTGTLGFTFVDLSTPMFAGKPVHVREIADPGAPDVKLAFVQIRSPAQDRLGLDAMGQIVAGGDGTDDDHQLGSLEFLWDTTPPAGVPTTVSAIDVEEPFPLQVSPTYTRQELTATLAALIEYVDPDTLRILDPTCLPQQPENPSDPDDLELCFDRTANHYHTSGWYGDDHAEHVGSARFALAAHFAAAGSRNVRWYRTYNTGVYENDVSAQQNLSDSGTAGSTETGEVDTNKETQDAYVQFDGDGAGPRSWNTVEIPIGVLELEGVWISFDEIATPDPLPIRCLRRSGSTPGSLVSLVPCGATADDAQVWSVVDRTIRSAGLCLNVSSPSVGAATLATCDGSPEQEWVFWSGTTIMNANGYCLSANSGLLLESALCSANDVGTEEWVWQVRTAGVIDVPLAGAFTASFFTDASLHGSLRFGDVDGDGLSDACWRQADGVYCSLGEHGLTFASPTRWTTDYSDAQNWDADDHGSTLMLGDLDGDGDADLCGRGNSAIFCSLSNGSSGFDPIAIWTVSMASNAMGGENPIVYSSLRLADVDGDRRDDLCGRSSDTSNDLECARSLGGSFDNASPAYVGWYDGGGFAAAVGSGAGPTLMMGDIDGDGRADVCERATDSVWCAVSRPGASPPEFEHLSRRSSDNFSDAGGWGAQEWFWRGLRLADVTGDGLADLCGRGRRGILCAFSIDGRFEEALHHVAPTFHNDEGWDYGEYVRTLGAARLDGNAAEGFCAARLDPPITGDPVIRCAVPEPSLGWLAIALGVFTLTMLTRRRGLVGVRAV